VIVVRTAMTGRAATIARAVAMRARTAPAIAKTPRLARYWK
jgi:hypothetical protein